MSVGRDITKKIIDDNLAGYATELHSLSKRLADKVAKMNMLTDADLTALGATSADILEYRNIMPPLKTSS